MMIKNNKRNSNMELLRVLAMLMIIAHHIWCHCVNLQLTDINRASDIGFYSPGVSKKLLFLVVISPMGQIGNAIFIIISGYFMVHKGKDINLTNITKKLLLQLGFAAIVISTMTFIGFKMFKEYSIRLMDFNLINDMSWFVGYYFIIIILAKLFLNSFLNNLDKKNYAMFIMGIFGLIQFYWSRKILNNFVNDLETVFTGIFLYSLGGFIKKYNPFGNIKTWVVGGLVVLINLIICGNYYIVTINKILDFQKNGGIFTQSIPGYGNYYFLPIVLGIVIFELFRRIKLPNSRVINYLGASTFMVYLIHDNEFVRKIWNMLDWITPLYDNMFKFITIYFSWTLGTFAIGFLFYTIYVWLGKLLGHCKPLFLKKNSIS